MNFSKGIKRAGVLTVLGMSMALLTACSGVSQADYDAAKQQLGAKEQELTAAKQQVTSLQQQAKPAAPREPKRLEAKITIVMGETKPSAMWFATAEGQQGGPFRLPAGKTVGLHFVNKGEKLHEFIIGRQVQLQAGKADGYQTNLFEKVAADVFVYQAGKMVEIGGAAFEELELDP
ncbi:MAG: hypothetical protein AAB502_06805, partial [Chloroflexota bacterium]